MGKFIFKSFFDKKRLLIFALFAIFIYFYSARLALFLSNSKYRTEQDSVTEISVPLNEQTPFAFLVTPSNSCWKGITLFFLIPDTTKDSLLYLKISDENGKTVFAQAVTELDSSNYHRFSFANRISAKNGTYTLLISGKNVDLKTNGQDSPQYKLYGNVAGKFLVPIIFIFVVALIAATAVLCFFIFYKKLKPETVFLITGTIFGLLFMCLMPPLTIGDECRHYDTAYEISNKMLGVKSAPGFIAKRATDFSLVPDDMFQNDNHTLFNYYETIWPHVFNELQKPKDLTITNAYPYANTITSYPFLFFLSSLGITFGRLLKLNFIITFLLGRFFNLAFFILVTYFALKKQTVAKNFFCFSALLPMLLHQVASFSYDSMLITVSLFFIMYVTEFAYNTEKKLSILSLILLCLSAFFIAPAKTLYFPLIACIFTINSKSFKQSKNCLLLPTFVILSAILGVITNHCISRMMTFVNNPVTGIGITLPPLESVNNYDSLKNLSKTSVLWIVSHLFQYLYILINTCRENLSYWIMTLGGRYLGWEAIPMNELLIYSICGMIFWQLARKTDGIKTTLNNRIISITIFVIIFLAILTGQFTMGIDPISPVIGGVQGRYLIPIVPLLFLFRKDIGTSCEDTELSIHFAEIGILMFLSIDLFFRIIGIF